MRKNILLIDESLTIHKIVELTIERESYELFNAYNAEEGVALASSEDMCCILIDVLIIKEDPYYMEKLHNASPKAEMIPLVSTFKQFQEIGKEYPYVAHHIVKPFNAPALNMVLGIASKKYEKKGKAEEGDADANEKEALGENAENSAGTEQTRTSDAIKDEGQETSDDLTANESGETPSSEGEAPQVASEAENLNADLEKEGESSEIEVEEASYTESAENMESATAAGSESVKNYNESKTPSNIPMIYQDGYGDIPVKDDLVITDAFAGKKNGESVTRNDLIVDSIEQDAELEILQEFLEKPQKSELAEEVHDEMAEAEAGGKIEIGCGNEIPETAGDGGEHKTGDGEEDIFPKDIYSYQDIAMPASSGASVPDVSTVIDIMDKVIAKENIDADLDLSEGDFGSEQQSVPNYGDVEVNGEDISQKEDLFQSLGELDSEDSEFKGVDVELGKTNEELFNSSETNERKEILELFPSAENSEKRGGFKRIAESNIPDKTSAARLYFELPREEFVEIFKKYLDKTTIDYLLHDTIKSVLEKMLPELLEKLVRKELERIIKGS
ncbi:MAG: hypothetical protein LBD73_01600 [Deferribacteraceae bacterium]|jgi:hypothetical protein|nr:hypothetical protein [Deferribacteraceae bacterium]